MRTPPSHRVDSGGMYMFCGGHHITDNKKAMAKQAMRAVVASWLPGGKPGGEFITEDKITEENLREIIRLSLSDKLLYFI